jgi:hypothetical protein
LESLLPKRNGTRVLDVLCISHGDKDHCGGFAAIKKEMDSGKLTVGSIWHPNYDRVKMEGAEGLPEDYLALRAEIMRRRGSQSRVFGNIEIPLTAWDQTRDAFEGLPHPKDFSLRVLSPYVKDEGDKDWDVNEISLVVNVTVSNLSILFTGDSGSKIWQERIIPYTLKHPEKKAWAQAAILVASHHGSSSFFDETREDCRDADPHPLNYPALDYISPNHLIVSASQRFPTNGDAKGDMPPHYAAWKWYHQWYRKKHGVSESDSHPKHFRYTADGHVRLEYENGSWKWVTDWSLPDPDGSGPEDSGKGFVHHGGETRRGGTPYA